MSTDQISFEERILLRYQNHEITGPAAAQELGMSYSEFMQLLAQRGIPTNYPTSEDLEHDLATLNQLRHHRTGVKSGYAKKSHHG